MAGQKNGGKNIAGKQKKRKKQRKTKMAVTKTGMALNKKWRKRKMAGVEKRRAIRKWFGVRLCSELHRGEERSPPR